MNNLCINVEIILYILSLCPSHDLSSGWIMAGRDLSRYRIIASYVLKVDRRFLVNVWLGSTSVLARRIIFLWLRC